MYFKLIKNLHPQFALLSYFARYVVRAAHRTRRKCTTRKVFALVVVAESMSTVANISRAVQWPSTVGTHGRSLLAATSHCEKKRMTKRGRFLPFSGAFREHSHFCVWVCCHDALPRPVAPWCHRRSCCRARRDIAVTNDGDPIACCPEPGPRRHRPPCRCHPVRRWPDFGRCALLLLLPRPT
jgi:hypothetical protein